MKRVSFIVSFCILFSFAITAKEKGNLAISTSLSDTAKAISKKMFKSYLKYFDTLQGKQIEYHQPAASCSWGTYRILTNRYILKIENVFCCETEKYYEIVINSSNSNKLVEILVYDKLNATLDNICTDVGDWNNPKANRMLVPLKGEIILAFTKSGSYNGSNVSILIKDLTFVDPDTGETVDLKNKVSWEVEYEGIPG